ncbi:MAG: hypothetical protein AAFQ43_14050 [Bacteroidota bacterium]
MPRQKDRCGGHTSKLLRSAYDRPLASPGESALSPEARRPRDDARRTQAWKRQMRHDNGRWITAIWAVGISLAILI